MRCASATSTVTSTTSTTNEIALFRAGAGAIAVGWFVHIFVERSRRRPAGIPPSVRRALERLVVRGPRRREGPAAVLCEMGRPAPYAQSRPLEIAELDLDGPLPARSAPGWSRSCPVITSS
jgi:hypothetical protein